MSNAAPRVYEYAHNRVVTFSANPINNNTGNIMQSVPAVVGSGFIIGVQDRRIIVITTAHEVLLNQGLIYGASPINSPFVCVVNNAVPYKSKQKQNISVNLFVVGMDIAMDMAVLASYRVTEKNQSAGIYFGFDFDKSSPHFSWGDSANTPTGTQVYSLTNAYAEGISESTGIIHDPNFIYGINNINYLNQTDQVLTSMNVDQGSSGAPVLVVNKNSSIYQCEDGCRETVYAVVIGMVAWLKITNGGNFIGGPAQKQMQKSFNRIMQLNSNLAGAINNPINFNGSTGKGWLGIISYAALDQTQSYLLNATYPAYANSIFSNKIGGFVITGISNPTTPPLPVIPNSRVNNAIDLATGLPSGIQIYDIIVTVNNRTVDLNTNPEYVTFESYNNLSTPIYMTIIRPTTGQLMNFKVTSDQYPNTYEIVSDIPNEIELISTVSILFYLNNITTPDNGKTLYLYLEGLVNNELKGYYTMVINGSIDLFEDLVLTITEYLQIYFYSNFLANSSVSFNKGPSGQYTLVSNFLYPQSYLSLTLNSAQLVFNATTTQLVFSDSTSMYISGNQLASLPSSFPVNVIVVFNSGTQTKGSSVTIFPQTAFDPGNIPSTPNFTLFHTYP